jgi:hypothetical protein
MVGLRGNGLDIGSFGLGQYTGFWLECDVWSEFC